MFPKFWIGSFWKPTLLHLQYFGKTDYRLWWMILLQGTKWLTFNMLDPQTQRCFWGHFKTVQHFLNWEDHSMQQPKIKVDFDSCSCSLEAGFQPELLFRTELFFFPPWPVSKTHSLYLLFWMSNRGKEQRQFGVIYLLLVKGRCFHQKNRTLAWCSQGLLELSR